MINSSPYSVRVKLEMRSHLCLIHIYRLHIRTKFQSNKKQNTQQFTIYTNYHVISIK